MWEDVWMLPRQRSDESTLYTELGVSMLASPEEIRRSFRRLALRYHPDKCGGSAPDGTTRTFHSICEAFKVLSDPAMRQAYDKTLVDQLDLQEYLNRFRDLVLTVQGLQLPHLRPQLHRAAARLALPQQQPHRHAHRCGPHHHHPQGHTARQPHMPPRPPLLTRA